mgnify:CR=1 FL=1
MSISVDVIVPVLNRPQSAAPFMETLNEPRANVIVVGEFTDIDTCQAWRQFDCLVLGHPSVHTFAEKVNEGIKWGTAPWVLLVGDDCRFVDGWLNEALTVASSTRAAVIGTNDHVNRRVINGSHTCHPMIRRTYIDTVGASWDGPGLVCHEGYRHNYVDDEIVCAAKDRGVWAMAPNSVIHHKHPVWGTAPNDATYKLGQSSADADRALFKSRRELHCTRK